MQKRKAILKQFVNLNSILLKPTVVRRGGSLNVKIEILVLNIKCQL